MLKVEEKLSKGWGGENAYHVSGYRYLLLDDDRNVSRASPPVKVTTLTKVKPPHDKYMFGWFNMGSMCPGSSAFDKIPFSSNEATYGYNLYLVLLLRINLQYLSHVRCLYHFLRSLSGLTSKSGLSQT